CPELNDTRTWLDLNSHHLLQLRVNLQDMAPPSTHPATGEKLRWSGRLYAGMLQPIGADALVHACNLRAAAYLIAAHWPEKGVRLLLRLAFARFFLEQLGLDDEIAIQVLKLACRLGGSDPEGVAHVSRAVRDTKDALDKGEKAIG